MYLCWMFFLLHDSAEAAASSVENSVYASPLALPCMSTIKCTPRIDSAGSSACKKNCLQSSSVQPKGSPRIFTTCEEVLTGPFVVSERPLWSQGKLRVIAFCFSARLLRLSSMYRLPIDLRLSFRACPTLSSSTHCTYPSPIWWPLALVAMRMLSGTMDTPSKNLAISSLVQSHGSPFNRTTHAPSSGTLRSTGARASGLCFLDASDSVVRFLFFDKGESTVRASTTTPSEKSWSMTSSLCSTPNCLSLM
mmetsp:Transcript_8987/g.17195  ORF Transcript_8987/g.17195 Transcript_8987/m.17195 type:complete len:250 (-) Transcript_8987:192-941(-)